MRTLSATASSSLPDSAFFFDNGNLIANTEREFNEESEAITPMKGKFSNAELTALRHELLQDDLIDSREGAELLQLFLAGRGYGASPEAAQDAVGRVEMSGCSMPVLQRELESLALVM